MDNNKLEFTMAYFLVERYYTMLMLHHSFIANDKAKKRLEQTRQITQQSLCNEGPLEKTSLWEKIREYIQIGNDMYFEATGEYDDFDTVLERLANGSTDFQAVIALMKEGNAQSKGVVD